MAWWVSGWKRPRNEKIIFLPNVRGCRPENTETEERVLATIYVQLVKVEEGLVCFPGGCLTNGLNVHTLLKSNRSSDLACAVSFNRLGAVLGGYSHEFVGQVNGVLEPACVWRQAYLWRVFYRGREKEGYAAVLQPVISACVYDTLLVHKRHQSPQGDHPSQAGEPVMQFCNWHGRRSPPCV